MTKKLAPQTELFYMSYYILGRIFYKSFFRSKSLFLFAIPIFAQDLYFLWTSMLWWKIKRYLLLYLPISFSSFQISHTRKVHISKIQVASNQTHVVSFHNVPGKITLSGKVDCIGCSIASSKVRVTRESDTILALFVNTVSNFAIEQAEVISPLRS